MRLSKVALAFIFSAVLGATTLASKVYTDYDPNANFSQYKTFMWIKTPHMADPLMSERIVNAINSELTNKGWQLVTERADVGIAAHIATKKERTLETFYSGFGGGLGLAPGGAAASAPQPRTWKRSRSVLSSSICLIVAPGNSSGAAPLPRCSPKTRRRPPKS